MNVASVSSSQASAAAALASSGNKSAMNALPQAEQVKAAAGQFEAIMLRQLLQDSVGKLAGGDKAGGGMYGYMLTDVIANKLSEGGGLGLSQIFQHQLTPRGSLSELAGDTAKGNS